MTIAYVVVDPQKDFVEGGKLPTDGALAIVNKINRDILDTNGFHAVSQDWHINPGSHFSDQPNYVDSFLEHCLANSEGAEFVDGLDLKNATVFRKGKSAAAFSAFEGITYDYDTPLTLSEWLIQHSVDSILVCGLLLDYCVMSTCLDGAKLGFTTILLTDYTIGSVNCNKDQVYKTLEKNRVLVS